MSPGEKTEKSAWHRSSEWAKKLSPLMEWVADWHHADHRDAILTYELGNILDITLKGGLNVLAQEQGTTQAEQLEAALGSYTNCR
jgi:hypothetical protein